MNKPDVMITLRHRGYEVKSVFGACPKWEQLQAEVERLTGQAGLQILQAILDDEVRQRVGPPYQLEPGGTNVRWGHQPGYFVFGGQKISVERPRVRTQEGEEVELENYRRLQQDGRMQRAVAERIVCVEELKLVALLIDGIEFAGQVMVVALGVDEDGAKHVLGLWQGATENAVVVKELLEDLVERGLDPKRCYLFVLDGSKALRAGIERVFGSQAEVQRCQIHKIRNVIDHLPEGCRADWQRRLRNAYAMIDYAAAKAALEKL